MHFSKRLLRRSPPGMGLATYHVTDWLPEIRDPALRLLGDAGLRGVAQVETILDPATASTSSSSATCASPSRTR